MIDSQEINSERAETIINFFLLKLLKTLLNFKLEKIRNYSN